MIVKNPLAPFRYLLGSLFLLWLASGPLQAALYTQTLQLDAGWNSVWLEVEPRYGTGTNIDGAMAVEDVFSNSAITIVATPQNPVGSAEFISDADTLRFNQNGWRVWRRVSEVQNDTLATISGNQAYLIYVSGNSGITASVTGKVAYHVPQWRADTYNLLGFGLKSSVSFNNFFAASGGKHPVNKIFRLQADGNWVGVRNTDLMESGKAYWIYSDGPSTFYGPVKVSFDGALDLDFGVGLGDVTLPDPQSVSGTETILTTLREITLTDVSGTPQTVTLTKISPSTSGAAAFSDDVRIYEAKMASNGLSYVVGPNGQIVSSSISVPASSTTIESLAAYRAWSSGAKERENLYRIEFAYNYLWLPMTASNPDLSDGVTNAANASYSGLWIGSVALNEVTSMTEAGYPSQPTTSTTPLRLIVHVDGSGNASLLSHVMLMQTKTADVTVRADQVLVVDEAKIPFFEGIETRAGKKVGKRFESVGYDMPRKMDSVTQAALLSAAASAFGISTNTVTEANIRTYVNGQATRPTSLVDSYYTNLPLVGGLAPGALVTTSTNQPLALDPFHRSNPFRHAYDPRHVTGYSINREVAMRFDAKYQAGVLTGTYEETVTGLAAVPIKTKGSLILRKISDVTTLQ